MAVNTILVLDWLPDGRLAELQREFTDCEWIDGRAPAVRDQYLGTATITYGVPPVARLADMLALRWIQLISAGVPRDLCPPAHTRKIAVTNLAGLYGPAIAEHTFALMATLAHNLHIAMRNQQQEKWDQSINRTMSDLHG